MIRKRDSEAVLNGRTFHVPLNDVIAEPVCSALAPQHQGWKTMPPNVREFPGKRKVETQ